MLALALWSLATDSKVMRKVVLPGAVVLAAALLAGCGIARMDEAPSKPVDLSGSWLLDRAASEDPQPLLDKLRPKPVNNRGWGPSPDDGTGDDTVGPPGGGQQGGGGGGQRRRRGGAGQSQPQMTYRNSNDAFTHGSVIKMLQADLARAGAITIRQAPDQFTIDYGSSVRSFTPGAVSVVSASWGVADQSSGWKGRDFVIQVRPQTGVASYERYTLSEDGQRLSEELQLGGGEYPSIKLKRVYARTAKPLPRAVPNNE